MPARPELRPDPLVQLALVPLRNASVRVATDTPARMVLEIDAVYSALLGPLPRMLGAKKVRRYELDGLGLEVWRLIDDRRRLGEVIGMVAEAEQLTFNESRLMVLHWLRLLAVRGLAVLGDRTAPGMGT